MENGVISESIWDFYSLCRLVSLGLPSNTAVCASELAVSGSTAGALKETVQVKKKILFIVW